MKVASVDNLLFVLLIAVAALFQLLSKGISKASKRNSNETSSSPRPQPSRPIQRAPPQSDADRIRKFLEALGQPPSATPPPPVAPRTDISPRRLAPVQPPRVIPGAWGLPREQRQKPEITQKESPSPEQPSRFNKFAPSPLPVVVATAFEVHEVAAPLDVPEQSVDKTPVEAHTAPKAFGVTKGPDLKTDIASLLASKSGLREAIILREIFGPPRGLHEPDAIL